MLNEFENKNLKNIEFSNNVEEDILEKINKQINFLKNRYDVVLEIEKENVKENGKENAQIDLNCESSQNLNLSKNKNEEILKITQEENIKLKMQLNNKDVLLNNLMDEMDKKKSLIDNLLKELESLKKEKLDKDIYIQNIMKDLSNPQLINYSREIYINNELKHLKNKESIFSINTMSTSVTPKDFTNLQNELEKLQKEKTAMEGQLVIYKLKYAESSSSLMDADDQKSILKKKNEDLLEKIKVKDDIIKNLVSERDNIREAYFNNSLTNRNETIQSYQTSNNNTNNISLTQRNSCEIQGNYNTTSHSNKISFTQMQNRDKQLRRGTTLFFENNNKSILSKNNDHLETKNIFDVEKYESMVNNNQNFCNANYTPTTTNHNTIVNNNSNTINNHKLSLKKSTGLIGSLKNLFGNDKHKK